ncbi:MAG: 4a-hydroxytetrahydrobiopterin dehydratase [Planctomycetota bacterium]
MADKLSESEIKSKIETMPEWSEVSGEIQRTYEFDDFRASMAFVEKVADLAEEAQHHPDILIRYNRVMLTLSTHDAGGLTVKDFDLASRCDELVAAAARG